MKQILSDSLCSFFFRKTYSSIDDIIYGEEDENYTNNYTESLKGRNTTEREAHHYEKRLMKESEFLYRDIEEFEKQKTGQRNSKEYFSKSGHTKLETLMPDPPFNELAVLGKKMVKPSPLSALPSDTNSFFTSLIDFGSSSHTPSVQTTYLQGLVPRSMSKEML